MTDWKPAAQPANQSAFWDDQRSRRQIEDTPDPIRRSYKLMWWVVLAFLIIGGISIARAFAAENPPPRAWMIWNVDADKPYHPHQFTSATACNTDIAGIKDGSGKRVACVKILKTGD